MQIETSPFPVAGGGGEGNGKACDSRDINNIVKQKCASAGNLIARGGERLLGYKIQQNIALLPAQRTVLQH